MGAHLEWIEHLGGRATAAAGDRRYEVARRDERWWRLTVWEHEVPIFAGPYYDTPWRARLDAERRWA